MFATRRINRDACIIFKRKISSVGLIGLGNMGGHMAANLLKGYPNNSLFYDISPANIERVKGAKASSSVSLLASNSDVIITMLPNTKHVIDVCRRKDGIFKVILDYHNYIIFEFLSFPYNYKEC
jgi:3-hydroxyisobutyrate dehydrogenase-like beta-hydroxyacid dehydrogenase